MGAGGSYHVVAQGECFSSIAKLYRFSDYRLIYDHPNNAELKAKRPNPNVLYPGDQVFIPDKERKKVSGATGKRHKFVIDRKKVIIRLVVKDENWEPFVGKNYQLKIDGFAYAGSSSTTDGKIEHPRAGEPDISPDLEEAELSVWLNPDQSKAPAVWKLNLGHLDPVNEVTGVQKRLANLGFSVGAPDGELNDMTRAALTVFQTLAVLEASGENDTKTRDALVQNHDKLSPATTSSKAEPALKPMTAFLSRLHEGSPADELSATLSFQRVFRF